MEMDAKCHLQIVVFLISFKTSLTIMFMSLIFLAKVFFCGTKGYANSVSQGNITKISDFFSVRQWFSNFLHLGCW